MLLCYVACMTLRSCYISCLAVCMPYLFAWPHAHVTCTYSWTVCVCLSFFDSLSVSVYFKRLTVQLVLTYCVASRGHHNLATRWDNHWVLSMATAQFRTLKEFCFNSESVKIYLDPVQLYFEANEVPEDKQVPILLSSIGSSTQHMRYSVTSSLKLSQSLKLLLRLPQICRSIMNLREQS